MSDKVAKILDSTDGKRRVLIVQRSDGNFAFVEQYRYKNMYDGKIVAEGWASIDSPASIFATPEIAEREAKVQYPWLS